MPMASYREWGGRGGGGGGGGDNKSSIVSMIDWLIVSKLMYNYDQL